MPGDHRSIKFRELEFEFSGTPQVASGDLEELVVTLVCPACQGEMTKEIWHGPVYGGKGWLRRRPPAPPDGPQVFICACGYPHAGRPPESPDTGCGAFWAATLR
ncbi:hypothetical protein [Micromonospora sp. NPDC049204]|uniref:hypothetical protein n=1 Tax=unclassified Micromonospora TaxID=2617518 RepID=UPI0033FD248E